MSLFRVLLKGPDKISKDSNQQGINGFHMQDVTLEAEGADEAQEQVEASALAEARQKAEGEFAAEGKEPTESMIQKRAAELIYVVESVEEVEG